MSDTKRFDNITDAEMKAKGVVSLAMRPNMPSQYGQGGLTGKQLQERFDRLARYIVEKYNILVDGLASHDVLEFFKLPEGYSLGSLYELVERISDSHGDLVVTSPYTLKDDTVRNILFQMRNEINSLDVHILDVDALPTTNVDADRIYRYNRNLYYYDKDVKGFIQLSNKSYVDIKSYELQSGIDAAKRIAQGANQAIAYDSYATMVTAFNSLPNDAYKVGQGVLIGTVNVPDLWVYAVSDANASYTYTSDEDLANALKEVGSVHIGYYYLSALETQKVDLSEYVQAYIGKKGTININQASAQRVYLEYGGWQGGTAYLSTEQTFTRNQLVGGTATIYNNYGGDPKTISITGSMITEETKDGICVVLDTPYKYAVKCIISAYTTNYQPSFAMTPCPAVGTYLNYWSYYDAEWVESINVEVVPTKYINNALIDLRSHPDYPSIPETPETPSTPTEATKLYKHNVYINSGNIGNYFNEAKIAVSYTSTSPTPITSLAELINSPAGAKDSYGWKLNYAYANYDHLDEQGGSRDVSYISLSTSQLTIYYVTAYTVPATLGYTAHKANQVVITDTVTEV